jgi:hypothetical protein
VGVAATLCPAAGSAGGACSSSAADNDRGGHGGRVGIQRVKERARGGEHAGWKPAVRKPSSG